MDKVVEKRRLLEERQKSWMSQRQNEVTRKQCEAEEMKNNEQDYQSNIPIDYACAPNSKGMSNNKTSNNKSSNSSSSFADHISSSTGDNSKFLSRLTDKLADRIREEVKKEFQQTSLLNSNESVARQALNVKMQSYLQAELSNYVCKICYEVMKSPMRMPILLFPCGHTFCKLCFDKCNLKSSKMIKFTCPYCRSQVDSSAINQSLKDLIDQFLEQSDKLQQKGILDLSELEEVFSCRHDSTVLSLRRKSTGINTSIQFQSRLKSCEMRMKILQNELSSVEGETVSAKKKVFSIQSACSLLEQEKSSVEERMQQLLEEKELVERHLMDQHNKLTEAMRMSDACVDKENMLKDTILSIKEEVDKLRVLVLSDDEEH